MYRRKAPNLSKGLKEGFLKEVTPKQRPEGPVRVGERTFWAVAEAQAKACGQETPWGPRQLYMGGGKV